MKKWIIETLLLIVLGALIIGGVLIFSSEKSEKMINESNINKINTTKENAIIENDVVSNWAITSITGNESLLYDAYINGDYVCISPKYRKISELSNGVNIETCEINEDGTDVCTTKKYTYESLPVRNERGLLINTIDKTAIAKTSGEYCLFLDKQISQAYRIGYGTIYINYINQYNSTDNNITQYYPKATLNHSFQYSTTATQAIYMFNTFDAEYNPFYIQNYYRLYNSYSFYKVNGSYEYNGHFGQALGYGGGDSGSGWQSYNAPPTSYNISVCFWYRPNNVTVTYAGLTKCGSTSNQRFTIYQNNSQIVAGRMAGGVVRAVNSSDVLNVGEWTHICFVSQVINSTYAHYQLYLNGSLYQHQQINGSTSSICSAQYNISLFWDYGKIANGTIDEYVLSAWIFNASDVQRIYEGSFRFFNGYNGSMLWKGLNFGSDNMVNISIPIAQEYAGSNLTMWINNGSIADIIVNETSGGNVYNYPIQGLLSNANMTIFFESSKGYYPPLIGGNITLDSWTAGFSEQPTLTSCNYSGSGNFQVPCYCNLSNILLKGVNVTVNETGSGTWDNITIGKSIAIPKTGCYIKWRNITIGK